MPNSFPPPHLRHPLILPDGTTHIGTVFLKAVIDHPRIEVGEYTYADAFDPPANWAARLAPYLHPQSSERLVIGKFCQIADGVEFITASANHRYDGGSSYPFALFDGGIGTERASLPGPGPDTVIGNDVWLGRRAMILPGAQVGDGVIVGAGAVVAGEVPAYSIVAGNPARVVRQRFACRTAERWQALAWWDWPIAMILEHEEAICGGDLSVLEQVRPT